MNQKDLLNCLKKGENTFQQFKANLTNVDALAAELIAFSNSRGGKLFIGVNDDGSLSGLTQTDIARLNQLVSNAASQSIRPAINPIVDTFIFDKGMVLVIDVEQGISRPYTDNNGIIWVKNGADKRKVTAREELQRIFQNQGLVHADEIPVKNSSIEDIDRIAFEEFFQMVYGIRIEETNQSSAQLLENINFLTNGELNLAGMLYIGKYPEFKLPMCKVIAISFPTDTITTTHYIDNQDITGRLPEIFRKTINFLMSNIHHIQAGQSVNSIGQPEIPKLVFEELIANALIHRDYFISAPIRVLVFTDRIEIISPGHLTNNLTVEKIKFGNSNARNPIIASFARKMLPYLGIGSGIMRAMEAYPNIEFIDDREANLFKAIVKRIPVQYSITEQ